MRQWLYICSAFFILLVGCEDVIEVDLDEGASQVAVDGFITNEDSVLQINITQTQGYFDSSSPTPLADAQVRLEREDGAQILFAYNSTTQHFEHVVQPADSFLQIGSDYMLNIDYNGETWQAQSTLNPVPPIDSIGYEYSEGGGGFPSGYFAQFYSIDLLGQTDYYWIKTFRNDTFISDPGALNIAVDASFSPEVSDGFLFIPPIRGAINDFTRPYQLGEHVRVELIAIDEDAYNFFLEARNQLNNAGLFAVPPANVRTNVQPVSDGALEAVGWFSLGAKSEGEITIE